MAQEYKFKIGDKVLCKTTLLNDKPRIVYKIHAVTEDGRYLIVDEEQNNSLGWFRDDELVPYAEPKKDKDIIVQEDYCSYEVAKLLKEKGFKCGATYSKGFVKDGDGFVGGLVRHEDNITHQMAMKWLREEKNVFIKVEPATPFPSAYTATSFYQDQFDCFHDSKCDTYEGAVEDALKYALENLI